MRSISLAALPLISLSLVAGCASPVEDELAGETAADEALDGKADAAADGAYTYFAIRGDMRKCASPRCGGQFLERLNRTTTVCHDGRTSRDACYAPELDWSESRLSGETRDALMVASAQAALSPGSVRAIVRGRFAPRSLGTVSPELGRFIVTEAWIAETDAVADGVFVKVRDAGVRCIAAPCESLIEKGLNTSRAARIAHVDAADANLSDTQLEAMIAAQLDPSGVLIAGDRYTFRENGRKAKGRTATAVFRRLVDGAAPGGCHVGGCSGQVCSDREGVITTCEWREEYACYATATCERQANGQCGWTETPELAACLGQ